MTIIHNITAKSGSAGTETKNNERIYNSHPHMNGTNLQKDGKNV